MLRGGEDPLRHAAKADPGVEFLHRIMQLFHAPGDCTAGATLCHRRAYFFHSPGDQLYSVDGLRLPPGMLESL